MGRHVMSDTLFSEADAYNGDPMQPDLIRPTPVSLIATLTRPDRELRVTRLIQQSHQIYDDGVAEHLGGRAAGIAPERFRTWGHGIGNPTLSGPMCSSCDARFIPGQTDLLDAIEATS